MHDWWWNGGSTRHLFAKTTKDNTEHFWVRRTDVWTVYKLQTKLSTCISISQFLNVSIWSVFWFAGIHLHCIVTHFHFIEHHPPINMNWPNLTPFLSFAFGRLPFSPLQHCFLRKVFHMCLPLCAILSLHQRWAYDLYLSLSFAQDLFKFSISISLIIHFCSFESWLLHNDCRSLQWTI